MKRQVLGAHAHARAQLSYDWESADAGKKLAGDIQDIEISLKDMVSEQ